MTTYHFQISPKGYRTPWSMITHRTRRFRSRQHAVTLAIRAANRYNAEVRLTCGKHPLQGGGEYFRSPIIIR